MQRIVPSTSQTISSSKYPPSMLSNNRISDDTEFLKKKIEFLESNLLKWREVETVFRNKLERRDKKIEDLKNSNQNLKDENRILREQIQRLSSQLERSQKNEEVETYQKHSFDPHLEDLSGSDPKPTSSIDNEFKIDTKFTNEFTKRDIKGKHRLNHNHITKSDATDPMNSQNELISQLARCHMGSLFQKPKRISPRNRIIKRIPSSHLSNSRHHKMESKKDSEQEKLNGDQHDISRDYELALRLSRELNDDLPVCEQMKFGIPSTTKKTSTSTSSTSSSTSTSSTSTPIFEKNDLDTLLAYELQQQEKMKFQKNELDLENASYEELSALDENKVVVGLKKDILNQMHVIMLESDTTDESAQCTICQEQYANGDFLRFLPCSHYFHRDCVDQWFERSTKCPCCKKCLHDDFQ